MPEERWPNRIIWAVVGSLITALIGGVGAYLGGFLPDVSEVHCWLSRPGELGDRQGVLRVLLSVDPDTANPIRDLNDLRSNETLAKLAGIKIVPICTRVRDAEPEDWNAEMAKNHAVAAAWAFKDENQSTLWTQKAGDPGPDGERPFDSKRVPIVIAELIVALKKPIVQSCCKESDVSPNLTIVNTFDGMLSDDTRKRRRSREQAIALGPDRLPDLMSWARGKNPTTYRVVLGTVYVLVGLLQQNKSDDIKKMLRDDDKAFLRHLQSNNTDPTFQQYMTRINSILE